MDPVIAIFIYYGVTIYVILSAWLRSRTPAGDRRGKSDKALAARLIYVLVYIISFFGITGILIYGGALGLALVEPAVQASSFLEYLAALEGIELLVLSPLISAVLIQVGLALPQLKQKEKSFVQWLHSSDHLEYELNEIKAALKNSEFTPSESEITKNREKLERHDIRITDNQLLDGKISVVTIWRKMSCLLRFIDAWKSNDEDLLTEGELVTIERINETDSRKLAHVRDIINAMQTSARQSSIEQLANHSPPEAIENQANVISRATIENEIDERDRYMLEINSEKFEESIKNIQRYFIKEYDILFSQVSSIASNVILFSGSRAEERWDELTKSGYEGLGEYHRLTIDAIVKFFFLTLFVVFGVMALKITFDPGSDSQVMNIAQLGTALGFAVLCGAVIGTNRDLASQKRTPWARIAAAGFASFFLFIFIFFTFAVSAAYFELMQLDGTASGGLKPAALTFGSFTNEAGDVQEVHFRDILPWTLAPIYLAVAICRISRINWPSHYREIKVRVFDGLLLATGMMIVVMVCISLHVAADTVLSARFTVDGALQVPQMIGRLIITGAMALLIGAGVIADIRKIARPISTGP